MTGMDSRGNLLISVATTVTLLIGLSSTLVVRTTRKQQAEALHALERTITRAADTGLELDFLHLAQDPLYAVRDLDRFDFDESTFEYVSQRIDLFARPDRPSWLRFRLRYSHEGTPIAFERSNPKREFDRIRVTCELRHDAFVRVVQADYELTASGSGVLVAYGDPRGQLSGKAGPGSIVIDQNGNRPNQLIEGPVRANGTVTVRGSSRVDASRELAGTSRELPAFRPTEEPSIDIERYEAAARSGAGVVFESLEAFRKAAWRAQARGRPLEGIIVVKWDPANDKSPNGHRLGRRQVRFGLGDSLPWTGTGPSFRTQGIEITGTLCLVLPENVASAYRTVFDCAVKINAADLSGVDPSDVTTFGSGYGKPYRSGRVHPHEIDISQVTGSDGRPLDNFRKDEDLPALIQTRGNVEFRGYTNICGALFTTGAITFDNAAHAQGSWYDVRAERILQHDGVLRSVNGLQYFYGCAIAGSLTVRGNATAIEGIGGQPAEQILRFAPETVDSWAFDSDHVLSAGKRLTRTSYHVIE